MERRKLLSRLFEPHPASPGVSRYTNAVLRTQDNKEVKFYDDLIRGKQVMVNFMYAECQGACSLTTQKLKRIYTQLKPRMGNDLFFYSISIKPEDDTPAALKHYAQMNKADLPGWLFLTGDPFDIQTIRFRLFGMSHPGVDLDDSMHAGMVRLLNDNRNSWGMAQVFASDEHILRRISWHDRQKSYGELAKEYNALQKLIDRDHELWGYRRDV
jgi:protein SCO1/2